MSFTAKITADITKFEQNIGKAIDSTNKLENTVSAKLSKMGDSFVNVGKKVSIFSAGVAAAGIGAAKAAIDFESAFAGVRKTVDATEAEFSALSEGIRQMSKEMPSAASDIAAVTEAAGQLGIENKNLLSFTRTMIGLGQATNLSANQAATQLARLANIMQMNQSDFQKLGSTIVELGNNFATTEAEISDMALRLAGAGNQVGISEAEILSLSAALSSVGINAEAGGTAFSKVLMEMQLSVETGGKSLDNFARVAGMTSSQFANAFRNDAAGALISFVSGLQNSEKAGISAIKVLDDLGITEIRMRDALLRSAGAGDLMRESIELGTNAWSENNALTREAEQRYATTASQIQILKNNVVDLGIQLGEIMLPTIIKVVDGLKSMTEWLRTLSPEMQTLVVTTGAIAAAAGPLLIVIGKILTALPKIKVAIAALSGPIGIVVAAIVAGATLIITHWDEIKIASNNVVEYVKDDWERLKESLSVTSSSIGKLMKGDFNGWMGDVKKSFDLTIDYLKNRWQQLKGIFEDDKIGNPDQESSPAWYTANEMTGSAGAMQKVAKSAEMAASSVDNLTKSFKELGEAQEAATAKIAPDNVTGVSVLAPVIEPTIDAKGLKEKLRDTTYGALADLGEGIKVLTIDLSSMLGNALTDVFGSVADAMMNGDDMMAALGASLLGTLGGIMVQLGQMVIATGSAIEAVKAALSSLGGIGAIAAGVALIAIGSLFKAGAGKLSRSMGSGGGYSSAPSMNNTSPSYGPSEYRGAYQDDFQVTFKIGTNELVGVLNTAEQRRNRI